MNWRRKGALVVVLTLLLSFYAAAAPKTVVPGGNTIGLRLRTDGVSVVELSENAPRRAGLKCGDVICAIDGTRVTSTQEVVRAVERSSGAPMELTVSRDGERRSLTLSPVQTEDGWRLGVYVRDSVSGIGTVTYYDTEDDTFGALGHGVNDGGALLPITGGTALPSTVASVVRGEKGEPGALQGVVNGRAAAGTIEKNTPQGIFGSMPARDAQPLPVASADEIRTGRATILSNVRGTEVEEFEVRVTALAPNDPYGRNLLLEVTDPALLAATGGIVQGMSGSPIVQNGKLIGAVTHVLVDDPTQGYGIFIQNMLDAAG